MVAAGMFISGAVLAWLSWWVEQNHFQIWSDYKKKYKKKSSGFMDWASRPNYVVYRFNVYVLWPLLFFLGASAMLMGVLAPFI